MGTFEGHSIPSVIYSIFALWWGFVTSLKYIRSQMDNKKKFQSSTYMPCFCCPTKRGRLMPIESMIKTFGLTIHSIVEVATGLYRAPDGSIKLNYENAHHVCMLSGFILAGFIEIGVYYGLPLPKKVEYAFTLLGFFIQALIMTVHLEGDNGLEHIVHTLWTIIIVSTFLAALAETYRPDLYWPSMVRIAFFFTQGTWLMQVAFVVWPRTSNPAWIWTAEHGSHVWLTISLMFHFMGCFIVLMIEYMIVLRYIKCLDRYYSRYEADLDEANLAASNKMLNRIEFADDNKEYSMLIDEQDDNEQDSFS